jgi:hypothetical protein
MLTRRAKGRPTSSMSEQREFTIEEANALVPLLHRLVSKQMLLRSNIEETIAELHKLMGILPRDLGPRFDDTPEERLVKEQLVKLMQMFESGWTEIQELGCIVKDPRIGLLDFYGRIDGELVFLCWRFGEESVAHYHGLTDGFSGRKPLRQVERHRLLN